MEMQITADFALLTAEQREHLAGFILTFPPIPAELMESSKVIRLHVESDKSAPEGAEVIDPAAAFGAQAPVSQAGPLVVIPPPPAATPVPSPVVHSTVEIDNHGLPWDARIHAGTKAKNADGSWKKKRGVELSMIAQVEAELKALMAIPAAPAPGPQLVTTAPPPPPPAAAPPPPPAAGGGDMVAAFVGLVGRASAAMQAGKITQEEIQNCCKGVDPNLVSLPLLANRKDLVPQVAALIDGIIAGRSA